MTPGDRHLVADLRELHLLLSFDRTLPEQRPMSSDLLLKQRHNQAAVVQRAIDRIVGAKEVA